jgi:ubiquinone/menaquinone biosynthesis C-methylase UbiE
MKEKINSLRIEVDRFAKIVNTQSKSTPSYIEIISVVFSILAVIKELEQCGFTRGEIVPYLTPVRETLSQSPFFKRMQNWPRGYQGDFETIEYLMSAVNRAPKETIAYHLEQYGLTSPAAQQHRNKVMRQAELILKKNHELENARFLSIACGSSPDLEYVQTYLKGNPSFTLYDYDKDALDYSKNRLAGIKDYCNFRQGNVLRINRDLRDADLFDLVITGGLFDYLNDKVVIKVLNYIWYNLLSKNGMVFFTNMSPDNPDRIWIEYLADWFLITRDEKKIINLCVSTGIPESSISISRDITNCTIMVEANKQHHQTGTGGSGFY